MTLSLCQRSFSLQSLWLIQKSMASQDAMIGINECSSLNRILTSFPLKLREYHEGEVEKKGRKVVKLCFLMDLRS